jgi:hypothetical protein
MFELIVFFTASTFWRTASTLERLLNCSTASWCRARDTPQSGELERGAGARRI